MNSAAERTLQGIRILVVDDEEILTWAIEADLKKRGATLATAFTAEDGRRLFDSFTPDLVVCDLKLPDGDGLSLLQEWKSKISTIPVILITAHGELESAVSAVRLSAFDYLRKPFDLKDLYSAVLRASEISQLRQKLKSFEGQVKGRDPVEIIGKSKKTKEMIRQLQRVADSGTDTVLITGETGTGKELAARAIHDWSYKKELPYVEINCASIPANLLESELFGYEKGAFTDARNRKLGLFEIAKNGTIFLDEIGELPLKLQAKLLRALEYRRFRRLGGIKDIEFSATIVAATNRNLLHEASAGHFRSDLYYRISVVPLEIPPLRSRVEDIEVLTKYFVKSICESMKNPNVSVSDSAIAELKKHDWPGNIRELKNTLQRAIVLENPKELTAKHLSIQTRPSSKKTSIDGSPLQGTDGISLPENGTDLNDVERTLITQALERSQYNQSKASELLGITRHVLRYRMEKHGLTLK